MGVLTQTMGTWEDQWPVSPNYWTVGGPDVYEQLSYLVQEATKLTSAQDLTLKVCHEVNALLRGEPHKWLLSRSQITQYQEF